MSRDDIIEQATKVMHAEVCCPCDPHGCDWANTPEHRYARALADAELLARPLPTRDEIAMTITGTLAGIIAGRLYTLNAPSNLGELSFAAVADAVLALLKGQDR